MTPSENLPASRFGSEFLTAGQSAFSSLQREIDRLFDDFHRGFGRVPAPATPRLDVSETNERIDVTAELPGLEQGDVSVTLADNALVIAGEKTMETETKDKNVWVAERGYGAFSRRIPLPPGVTEGDIEAKMAKGVLHVTVKKPANSAHQKIEVKAA